jgi:hypothetical protein
MGTAEQNDFDGYRDRFVEEIEGARESQSEEQLAAVLDRISNAAYEDLARRSTAEDNLIGVDAWASVHSYAVARFYFEGPESLLRKGGYSERVAAELQKAVNTYGSHLRSAVAATGASAFSISVGFPFGVSVALEWSV